MRRNIFSLIIEDIDHKPISHGVAAFALAVGIFCGAFYPSVLSGEEAAALHSYLNALMRAFADTSPNILSTILQSLWNNLRIVLIIAVAGTTRFGSPIIVIAELVKGFGVGVGVSAICHVFGWGGLLLAFVSVLPQNLLYLPAYMLLGAKALTQSVSKVNSYAPHNRNRYFGSMLPCLYAILAGIILESVAIPFILKLISPWFI